MKRKVFWLLLALLLFGGLASGVFSPRFIVKPIARIFEPLTEDKKEEKKSITIALVGDIMLDRGVKRSVEKNFSGDYAVLFANVLELKTADITFGNLEGPIASTGRNVGSQYSFRMNPSVLPALKAAGFDVFSFANNHVGDWSKDAFLETMTLLDTVGMQYAGAGKTVTEALAPRIVTVQGKRIGFLAFSDVGPAWLEAKNENPGILLAKEVVIKEAVESARPHVDVLIASFHWGEEYQPRTARQKKLAELTVDAGADVVVGHHPHVIQATETYKGKPIFYSLGNFIFDQSFSPETMRGALVLLTITPEGGVRYEQKTVDLSKVFQPQVPRLFEKKRCGVGGKSTSV